MTHLSKKKKITTADLRAVVHYSWSVEQLEMTSSPQSVQPDAAADSHVGWCRSTVWALPSRSWFKVLHPPLYRPASVSPLKHLSVSLYIVILCINKWAVGVGVLHRSADECCCFSKDFLLHHIWKLEVNLQIHIFISLLKTLNIDQKPPSTKHKLILKGFASC